MDPMGYGGWNGGTPKNRWREKNKIPKEHG